MFLIDKPYISEFLVKTIRDNGFQIIATPVANELIKDADLAWITEEEAIATLKSNPKASIYSNSENALAWIEQNLGDCELTRQIKVLKDKVQFRDLLKEIFPDFYYQQIKLEDIHNLSASDLRFPLVIKPAIGFFSIGVHIVENAADWIKTKTELQPKKLESIFPESVLNTRNFIIEAFIPGEEYAIDFYYDHNGEVVLLNVLHHLFSSGTDTNDRVYSTSKEIIETHKSGLESFLNQIGARLNLRNFPAHAEVRIDKNGEIVPIEINPLRFGGWCTTGDLLGLALGFNAYQCFFEHKRPDWEKIFKGKENKKFSIVILNNNSGIDAAKILNFKYSALLKDFENPVVLRKFDIMNYPVFGFLFTESTIGNEKELTDILTSDLRKYITSKES